jgi:glutamyl/glutaminyl-tRNA synthetase
MIKVRFAPSPTGIPHIGSTRTALLNFLFAKANNGKFILRIEDTDQKRLFVGAEEAILESLRWLELDFDGEPVRQSKRLEIYKKYAQELLDKKIAHEKDGAVWVKVPEDKIFEWEDKVGKKKISFSGKDVDEFVILKSDGYPTYHLANVVDDHEMEITHVLRGEEWISSTPKHLYLYEVFGWTIPQFAHMPVILGTDKTKLSKRHGAKSALDYRKEGFVKEALINFMALLGWNPGGDKEQMDLSFMIKNFKLEDINTANPIFDIKKLEWLNGVWIRTLNEEKKLKERLEEFYKDDEEITKKLKADNACNLVNAAASRMRSLTDFQSLIDQKRQREIKPEEKAIASKLFDFLVENLGENNWNNEKFLETLRTFSKTEDVPFKIIYFLLSGKEQGIGLLELNTLYGTEYLINNLNA